MTRRWTWTWLALSATPLLVVLAGTRARHEPDVHQYATAYALRLTSDWPVHAGESDTCTNNGNEVLEGVVRRIADSTYTGRFSRTTRLGFCGAHGRDQASNCGLHLDGHDSVEVGAIGFDDGRGPELRLRWQSIPGMGTVTVNGTCSDRFEHAMSRMYRGAVHEVEVPVTASVIGNGGVRLTEYPWVVAVTLPRATDSLDLPSSRRAAGR